MFESRDSETIDDKTPLLPNYREMEEKEKPKSYSTTGILVAVACLVSLALLSVIIYSSGNKYGSTSFSVEVKSLDNEIGEDGTVYCNEEGFGVCLDRVAGICVKNGPCVYKPTAAPTSYPTSIPTSNPTPVPTSAPFTSPPSALPFCNPKKPPCKAKWLGLCWAWHECGSPAPSQAPTEAPTPKPTLAEECDPLFPPCKHDYFGVCYEYFKCPEKPKESEPPAGEPKEPPSEEPKEPPADEPKEPPAEEPQEPPAEEPKEPPAEEPKKDPGNGSEEPQQPGSDPKEPGSGGVPPDENVEPVTEPTYAPFTVDIFDLPTAEPTTRHNCDPENPPCKTWELGICKERVTCYGVHNIPTNVTWDDDLTLRPTPMPVPNPTPVPSQPPSSVPTTSGPTYTGYTPSPTISMMPTPALTFGPTAYNLCDPQNPPCDVYFFGTCMGKRYCYGSHEPTPSPTPEPTVATFSPTESPVENSEPPAEASKPEEPVAVPVPSKKTSKKSSKNSKI